MKKKLIITFTAVVLAVLVCFTIILMSGNSTQQTQKRIDRDPIAVKVHIAERRDVTQWLYSEGVAQAVRKEFLTFEQPGIVAQIGRDENGDELREGSKIIGPDSFGGPGQMIARLQGRESLAQYDVAQTAFQQAKKTYNRTMGLLAKNIVSEFEAEQATSAFKTAQAQLNAAKARLDKTTLFAPFDGVITLMNIKQGSYVSGGIIDHSKAGQESGAAVVVMDNKTLEVVLHLPAHQAGKVKKGQAALIGASGQDIAGYLKADHVTPVIRANVWSVSPSINIQKRSVLVRLRSTATEDSAFTLKDGMFVTAWVASSHSSNAISIPYHALIQRGDDSFVFAYDLSTKTAQKKVIRIGLMDVEHVEVIHGLSEGDLVVTDGQHLLTQGAKIRMVDTVQAKKKGQP